MGTILGFLTVANVKKYWWVIVIVAAAPVAIFVWNSYIDDVKEVGRLEERTDQLEGVIDDVQTSQEAERHILDANSFGKYCQCLRSARTPDSCTRYLPDVYTANGGPSPKCEQR